MAVGPQIAIAKILEDLKFSSSVRDCQYEILADVYLVIAKVDHETTKFSGYMVHFVRIIQLTHVAPSSSNDFLVTPGRMVPLKGGVAISGSD